MLNHMSDREIYQTCIFLIDHRSPYAIQIQSTVRRPFRVLPMVPLVQILPLVAIAGIQNYPCNGNHRTMNFFWAINTAVSTIDAIDRYIATFGKTVNQYNSLYVYDVILKHLISCIGNFANPVHHLHKWQPAVSTIGSFGTNLLPVMPLMEP